VIRNPDPAAKRYCPRLRWMNSFILFVLVALSLTVTACSAVTACLENQLAQSALNAGRYSEAMKDFGTVLNAQDPSARLAAQRGYCEASVKSEYTDFRTRGTERRPWAERSCQSLLAAGELLPGNSANLLCQMEVNPYFVYLEEQDTNLTLSRYTGEKISLYDYFNWMRAASALLNQATCLQASTRFSLQQQLHEKLEDTVQAENDLISHLVAIPNDKRFFAGATNAGLRYPFTDDNYDSFLKIIKLYRSVPGTDPEVLQRTNDILALYVQRLEHQDDPCFATHVRLTQTKWPYLYRWEKVPNLPANCRAYIRRQHPIAHVTVPHLVENFRWLGFGPGTLGKIIQMTGVVTDQNDVYLRLNHLADCDSTGTGSGRWPQTADPDFRRRLIKHRVTVKGRVRSSFSLRPCVIERW
jgi:hypothetical protein